MLKYLRIAVTALSLTACVLLVALWVRSYWWMDNVAIWSGNRIMSVDGNFRLNELVRINTSPPQTIGLYGNQSFPAGALIPAGVRMAMPYAMAVAAAAALTVAPWFKWSRRFSLRTLLIATTLIAALLGLVVTLSR